MVSKNKTMQGLLMAITDYQAFVVVATKKNTYARSAGPLSTLTAAIRRQDLATTWFRGCEHGGLQPLFLLPSRLTPAGRLSTDLHEISDPGAAGVCGLG
jgi:hypothetical protein